MFARALLGLGFVVSLSTTARADWAAQQAAQAADATWQQSLVGIATTMQANVIAYERSLMTYGQPAYGGTFGSRSSWVDLRLRPSGSANATGSRLILARNVAVMTRPQLRFAPTNRVGGLGRQLSGNSPSVSFGGISSGGEGGTPSFGNLHEGSSSFSFSKP